MLKLTNKEEQVMKMLWKLEKAFVKEILAEFDEKDKPQNWPVFTGKTKSLTMLSWI